MDRNFFQGLPDAELLNPRGYSPEFLRSILRANVLREIFSPRSTAIGSLDLVRQAAYQSVELALSLGITISLFTSPVRRYAPELWHERLAAEFMAGGMLGGMMITEPGCGTDMLACQTHCEKTDQGYELIGTKHWAGLTGLADYWLVLAKDEPVGQTKRFPSLNFYICRHDPVSFKVTKTYGSAGLRSIPYGITDIHAREAVLAPLLVGNRARRFRQIHGILQRSRISIAAITYGACQRVAADVLAHVKTRQVFGQALAAYGQVQARVAEIVASREISKVLFDVCCREADASDAAVDVDVDGLTANIVKVVSTDLAFAAATSASQLLGGDSYRTDTYIGRATADLRPFRIFEGSNDVLCEAVWAAVEKAANTGGPAFRAILATTYDSLGMSLPAAVVCFEGDPSRPLPQGLRCLGGRILANAFSLQWCAAQGLSVANCHPLVTRMNRDFATAEINGRGAGLVEY